MEINILNSSNVGAVAQFMSTVKPECYGSTPLSIPSPQFVIFYNGEQEVPEREIMQLSSLYTVKEEWPKLELEAVMLNIRPGHNQSLMEAIGIPEEKWQEYEKKLNESQE